MLLQCSSLSRGLTTYVFYFSYPQFADVEHSRSQIMTTGMFMTWRTVAALIVAIFGVAAISIGVVYKIFRNKNCAPPLAPDSPTPPCEANADSVQRSNASDSEIPPNFFTSRSSSEPETFLIPTTKHHSPPIAPSTTNVLLSPPSLTIRPPSAARGITGGEAPGSPLPPAPFELVRSHSLPLIPPNKNFISLMDARGNHKTLEGVRSRLDVGAGDLLSGSMLSYHRSPGVSPVKKGANGFGLLIEIEGEGKSQMVSHSPKRTIPKAPRSTPLTPTPLTLEDDSLSHPFSLPASALLSVRGGSTAMTMSSNSLPNTTSTLSETISDCNGNPLFFLSTSRYKNEFLETTKLGRGGKFHCENTGTGALVAVD